MKHELKIWPQYYCRVADGSKTFEVRKNDRGFQPGDTVVLKEWDPELKHEDETPTGRDTYVYGWTHSKDLEFTIGYVLPIDAERVVFSLLPTQDKKVYE